MVVMWHNMTIYHMKVNFAKAGRKLSYNRPPPYLLAQSGIDAGSIRERVGMLMGGLDAVVSHHWEERGAMLKSCCYFKCE